MKKVIVMFVMTLIASAALAQTNLWGGIESDSVVVQSTTIAAYKLFKTENMWTFIKLNTRNGKMQQVRFSNDDKTFETPLNLIPLVTPSEEVNGRFTLYPTQNTNYFILLDQIDGRTYRVRWSQKSGERAVVPILSKDN
jgi:hypothetical protein